jgi:hypothetical protein
MAALGSSPADIARVIEAAAEQMVFTCQNVMVLLVMVDMASLMLMK